MSCRFLRYFNLCLLVNINNKSKKNSAQCFLRTMYPREDGSYLISFQFSKTNMTNMVESLFIYYSFTDSFQTCSVPRGIEGFQLLYELSPSVNCRSDKLNVVSVVSCYIMIDGTSTSKIHGSSNFHRVPWTDFEYGSDNLPMKFFRVLSSHLKEFNLKVIYELSSYS